MQHRAPLRSLSAIVIAALAASGCATIVKGTNQPMLIASDPPGARCLLTRDGMQIALVDPTPGSVEVGKIHRTIFVKCSKVGFQDASQEVYSRFQTVTLGNILLGGLIGFGVDAMSGAMYEYPAGITVSLVPESFASNADRDAFFDGIRASAMKEGEELRVKLRSGCGEDCESRLKAIDEAVAKKLAEIESRRHAAPVRGSRS